MAISGLLDYGQSLSPRPKTTTIGDIQQRVSALRSTLGRRHESKANALKARHSGFSSASNVESVLSARSLSEFGFEAESAEFVPRFQSTKMNRKHPQKHSLDF